jgi:hypothetical protein
MELMKKIEAIKPSWDNRRKIIKVALTIVGILLFLLFAGAVYLTFLGKFGLAIASFFIVFLVCNFISGLGIIGSYIFGARWENKDFLNALQHVPDFMHNTKDDDDSSDDDAPNIRDVL